MSDTSGDGPTSSDVHTDAIMGSGTKAPASPPGAPCKGCGMWIGTGYRKCPKCGTQVIAKFNGEHDALGRFASGPGGLAAIAAGAGSGAHGVGVSSSFGQSTGYAKNSKEAFLATFANREQYAPSPRAAIAREMFIAGQGASPIPNNLTSIMADQGKARDIADHYMSPSNFHQAPDEVQKAAYADLVKETGTQMRYLKDAGVKVEYLSSDEIKSRGLDPQGLNPYPTAAAQAADVEKGHLAIASIAEYTDSHHPILDNSKGGSYDQFRAVHDFYGHAAVGTGFDRHGEYQAWLAHMSMFHSEGARQAASSELTAENSTLINLPPGAAAPHLAELLPAYLDHPVVEHGQLVRKATMTTCADCGKTRGSGYVKCPNCGSETVAKAATETCADCHKTRGKGYQKCPNCGSTNVTNPNDPDGDGDVDVPGEADADGVTKGMGFGGSFGKFPTPIPSSSSTRFNPDPRLHSHPFEPDPSRPSSCKQCGMGTGAHGRMVTKPQDPPAEPVDSPVSKGIFGRIMDRAANLLVPQAPDTLLRSDDATPILKAIGSKRYSMAPVYMPGQLDAHGDFIATADDLQMATWGYVEETAADRTIYLQHSPNPAGKWVEIMAWPYEVTTELIVPGDAVTKATSRTVTLPAGTVYMGVIWEPWANEEVQKGTLRGFSLGGTARRVEAVLS